MKKRLVSLTLALVTGLLTLRFRFRGSAGHE
jgi:hypothetical protein